MSEVHVRVRGICPEYTSLVFVLGAYVLGICVEISASPAYPAN